MSPSNPDDERSQAYTLEGVFASVVVLTALLYGVQVVDLGPWASDTSEETQALENRANDVLNLAAENGSLGVSIRCYDVEDELISPGVGGKDTPFERMLNQTFDNQDRQYNIYFDYMNRSGGQEREIVSITESDAESGVIAPTDGAVVATRKVAVYDDMLVRFNDSDGEYDHDCADSDPDLTIEEYAEANPDFYLKDVAPNSPLYNIVEVRIVAW